MTKALFALDLSILGKGEEGLEKINKAKPHLSEIRDAMATCPWDFPEPGSRAEINKISVLKNYALSCSVPHVDFPPENSRSIVVLLDHC